MGVACGIVAATCGGTLGHSVSWKPAKGAPCMVLAATRSTLELNGFCVKYAIVIPFNASTLKACK